MPSVTILLAIWVTLILSMGCNQTRYITERYIKNNIEQHKEGEYSTIRTYIIYHGAASNGSRYLEFTGYEYQGRKALVIGTDRLTLERKKFKEDNTVLVTSEFTRLSLAQAQLILNHYEELIKRLQSEKVKKGEAVYHDFTLSSEVFISFKKVKGINGKDTIHFWIKGEKYSLMQGKIIQRLRDFVR